MAERTEKLTEEITVKISPTGKNFAAVRGRQKGFESIPEYIRHLVEQDQAQAALDHRLLCEALGLKETTETNGFLCQKSSEA